MVSSTIVGAYGFEDNYFLNKMKRSLQGPKIKVFSYEGDGVGIVGAKHSGIKESVLGYNEDKNIVVFLNGKIFNPDLLESLKRGGHKFHSDEDAEIIAHAYEEYGWDCAKRIDGPFVFALWDSRKKVLFLSRDRVGEKALFYAPLDGKLLFASRIAPLLDAGFTRREMNPDALYHYLTLRLVPSPITFFKGISKLFAASSIILKRKMKKIEYWDASSIKLNYRANETEAAENIKKLMISSIEKRINPAAKVGVPLSGGIDSSAIVAFASRMYDRPLTTYSAAMEGSGFDEFAYAKLISEKFSTNHKEFVISQKDITKALPEMVDRSAEPIPHVVSVFIHHLGKWEEKNKIELVLDGLGPDELFCGYVNYPWVFGAHQIAKYSRIFLSKRLRRFFAEGIGRVSRNIVTEFLPDVLESEDGVPFWSIGFSETERKKLLTFKLQRSSYSFLKHKNLFKMNFDEFYQTLKSLEFQHRLPDKFFREVEYLGSPSIDVAFPYLDYALIDYALTIPSSMNMKVSTGKYLFKKAMTGMLPRATLERKKKIGFGFHFSRDPSFLKSLFGAIEEEMNKSDFGKFFDKTYIQGLLRRPVANVEKLWLLLNLTLWYNNWILEA